MAAARREFVRSGIQKARIEDITQACGLSKGAFYLHFESKEALFREVVQALEVKFEAMRQSREGSYAELISRGIPPVVTPRPSSPSWRPLTAAKTASCSSCCGNGAT